MGTKQKELIIATGSSVGLHSVNHFKNLVDDKTNVFLNYSGTEEYDYIIKEKLRRRNDGMKRVIVICKKELLHRFFNPQNRRFSEAKIIDLDIIKGNEDSDAIKFADWQNKEINRFKKYLDRKSCVRMNKTEQMCKFTQHGANKPTKTIIITDDQEKLDAAFEKGRILERAEAQVANLNARYTIEDYRQKNSDLKKDIRFYKIGIWVFSIVIAILLIIKNI